MLTFAQLCRKTGQAWKPGVLGVGVGRGQYRNQEGVLEARVQSDRAGAQRMRHMQLAAYPSSS